MSPSTAAVAHPDAQRGSAMRRVPGAGGACIGLTAGLVLSRWSPGDIAATMATAGLSGTADPLAFAIAGGVVAGVVGWATLYLIWGRRGWLDRSAASSHHARRPLSYDDLGPPPPREQPLPNDLDQPLSAFDPDAIDFHQRRPR